MITSQGTTGAFDAEPDDLDLTVTTIADAPTPSAAETPTYTCTDKCGGK